MSSEGTSSGETDRALPGYTEKDVDGLADVIGQAHRSGVLAGAWTLARIILDAGYRLADTDEQHVIEFRDNGWTMSHPLSCGPKLFDCPVNRVAERELTERPAALGRFKCELNDVGDRLLIGDRVGDTDPCKT